MTLLYHCTHKEYVLNDQCLATIPQSSGRSSRQSYGASSLVWTICQAIINSSSHVWSWNLSGGRSVCFKNYRSLSCIDTSRFIWISCVVRVWSLRHPVWFGDLATSAGPLEGQWVACEPCVAIYNNSNKVLIDNLPLVSSRRNQRVWLWSLDDVESISCSMIYIYTHI